MSVCVKQINNGTTEVIELCEPDMHVMLFSGPDISKSYLVICERNCQQQQTLQVNVASVLNHFLKENVKEDRLYSMLRRLLKPGRRIGRLGAKLTPSKCAFSAVLH